MRRSPNVVVVMTDQHRADHCRREGFALDPTPFADELAAQGAWFDRAYTTSPLCSPARTSMLTGRYPTAHRVRENPGRADAVRAGDLVTVLRAQGYATALVGKNHTYLTPSDVDAYLPYDHGGACGRAAGAGHAFDAWLTGLRHRTSTAPTPFPVELQNPYRIVSEAVEWVDGLGDRPFFLWLSFPEPHNPYQVPEPYFSMFPPDEPPPVRAGVEALAGRSFAWRYLRMLGERAHADYGAMIPRARSNYLGMLRLVDDQLRRFVGYLDKTGRRADTLLVVTADHGDYVGEYGLVRKGAELPEVLTRIPLLVNGPGVAGGRGTLPAHVSIADVLPTVCSAVGADTPAGVQGRDMWPLLTGADAVGFDSAYAEQGVGGRAYTAADVPEPLPGLGVPDGPYDFDELNAVTQGGSRRMVRKGDWKLVLDAAGAGQLYDLRDDPFELRDLWCAPEHLAVRCDLLVDLARWTMTAEDPLPIPDEGYPRL